MKNKAFLSILEQLCMILIFAIACAICLRVFSLANEISKDRDSLDQAVIAAQNAAELLKSNKGDLQECAQELLGNAVENTLTVFYNSKGEAVDNETDSYFSLVATKKTSQHSFAESAQITIIQNNKTIFELDVVWQSGGSSNEE